MGRTGIEKGSKNKPDMRVWNWICLTYFTNMWETVAKVRRLGEGAPICEKVEIVEIATMNNILNNELYICRTSYD